MNIGEANAGEPEPKGRPGSTHSLPLSAGAVGEVGGGLVVGSAPLATAIKSRRRRRRTVL